MLWMDPFRLMSSPLARPAAFMPAADVTVSDSDIVLTMDVPGVTADGLHVELCDGYLTVTGERALPQVPEGTTFVHSERPFGPFERRIKVAHGIDVDRVTASVDNGVLSLIIPKPERLEPRAIRIGSGAAEQRELEVAMA